MATRLDIKTWFSALKFQRETQKAIKAVNHKVTDRNVEMAGMAALAGSKGAAQMYEEVYRAMRETVEQVDPRDIKAAAPIVASLTRGVMTKVIRAVSEEVVVAASKLSELEIHTDQNKISKIWKDAEARIMAQAEASNGEVESLLKEDRIPAKRNGQHKKKVLAHA